jgi:hypothetical protein
MKKLANPVFEEVMEAFERNSSELYSLAFLLTGNEDKSVEAFGRALDFDKASSPDFCGSVSRWARTLTIVETLRGMRYELLASIQRVAEDAGGVPSDLCPGRRLPIRLQEFQEAVTPIDAFPRCVILLTIFEGMPIDAAAVLLQADEALLMKAQRIGIVSLAANLADGSGPYRLGGPVPVPILSLS